ncbi:MAG: hypothetical protein PHN64_04590 [Desulfovibrionaceae bacterium]|nr:hypothetical protein [Desulfovibrionaceae bacterium]
MMKPASALLLALTVLCSACGARQAAISPPLVLALPDCPAPEVPLLPPLEGAVPLDSPQNIDLLMQRDDSIRRYVAGLQASISCYQRQNTKENHEPKRP